MHKSKPCKSAENHLANNKSKSFKYMVIIIISKTCQIKINLQLNEQIKPYIFIRIQFGSKQCHCLFSSLNDGK